LIATAVALLRAFASDRVAAVLSVLSPVALFTVLGLFYSHLESSGGVHFRVRVVDASGTSDGSKMVAALRAMATSRLSVHVAPSDFVCLAEVRLPEGFSSQSPKLDVISTSPMPGVTDAVVQMVRSAYAQAFGGPAEPVAVGVQREDGLLVRSSVSGIAVVFMLFAASSLIGRGLGDDAAGLRERVRALGVGSAAYMTARIAAVSVIALVQLLVTLIWANMVFGVTISSPLAVLAAAPVVAVSCGASYVALASFCGSRARFVAVAPVATMSFAALSGAFFPRILMPDAVSRIGMFLFPGWSIDLFNGAIDGYLNVGLVWLLLVWSIACALLSVRLEARRV